MTNNDVYVPPPSEAPVSKATVIGVVAGAVLLAGSIVGTLVVPAMFNPTQKELTEKDSGLGGRPYCNALQRFTIGEGIDRIKAKFGIGNETPAAPGEIAQFRKDCRPFVR